MDTQEQTIPSSSPPANKPNSMTMIFGIIVLLVIGGGAFFFMNQKPQNTTQTPLETQPTETMQKVETTPPSETMEKDAMEKDTMSKTQEFTVTGSNFSFEPAEIKVKKGDSVKIIFKNADGMHDFVIDEFNAKTEQIKGGEQAEVTFIADKAGSFEYYCSVGKHRQMGMKGTLIVE